MGAKVKERTYTVTEAEYQAELAQGLTEDEVLKPGTYKVIPSRFRPRPGDTDPNNCKVKVTMYLDADVLAYFKKRAQDPNAAPYQTQINNELRRIMEEGSKAVTTSVEKDILNDKKFLKALKKKLEAV